MILDAIIRIRNKLGELFDLCEWKTLGLSGNELNTFLSRISAASAASLGSAPSDLDDLIRASIGMHNFRAAMDLRSGLSGRESGLSVFSRRLLVLQVLIKVSGPLVLE